jgi:hypothetical protein
MYRRRGLGKGMVDRCTYCNNIISRIVAPVMAGERDLSHTF